MSIFWRYHSIFGDIKSISQDIMSIFMSADLSAASASVYASA